MLRVDRLSVEVPGKLLLNEVSLVVPPGQGVGLVGPSGCGKSTMLRTIAGLIDARGGTVQLGGVDRAAVGWPEFRRKAPYLSQVPSLVEGSVNQNLERPFTYRSASGGYEREKALRLLRAVGMDETCFSADVRSLSVGEQQRVCLVRALLAEPRFLLLDEPTSALDEENTGRVEALLLEEADRSGLGFLLVTHDREQAVRVCGSVLDLGDFKASSEVTG